MKDEPDVVSLHSLPMQFRLLIEKPIQRVLGPSIKTYKIIVIDALDECTDHDMVEKLIQAIVTFAPNMPLKFHFQSGDNYHPERDSPQSHGSAKDPIVA